MEPSQSRTGNEAPPPSRSAIRAREARIKYWRVLIVSVFFAAVIGVNMIIGAAALIDTMQEHAKAEVAAVEKRKTGKISRPMLDGVFCRTTVFNNKSGEAQEDKIERCDDGAPVRSLKTDFVWNGKR